MELRKPDGIVWRHEIEKQLKAGSTAKQALDLLFGEYGDCRTDYKVIRRWYSSEKTVCQRLNTSWALPFTWICSPFQYVIFGQVGWSESAKFGAWLLRVTGEHRDFK